MQRKREGDTGAGECDGNCHSGFACVQIPAFLCGLFYDGYIYYVPMPYKRASYEGKVEKNVDKGESLSVNAL